MAPMSLPPGFRFHPTDEELVTYYLDRKITGRKIDLEIIPQIDLYKCEPWDLPDKSYLPSKDMEWYFYSQRDRKYPNGSRTNRATRAGYWKATGKDRLVQSRKRPVGMKKTLVYYRGRAPHGIRTNWVMHEYRLIDDSTNGNAPSTTLKDSFALCRVFKKTTQIPKIREEEMVTNNDDVENETTWFSDENLLIEDNSSNNEIDIIDTKYEDFRQDLKKFPSDTSSSDITQGTGIETGTPVDELPVPFAATDEANSSTNYNFFFSNADCSSSFFQDFEMPTTACSRSLNYSYQLPPLAIEDFPMINIKDTTKQSGAGQLDSFDEYMNFDDHKDHIYTTSGSTTMLDEILSLCSTSKDTSIDLSSFHDFS